MDSHREIKSAPTWLTLWLLIAGLGGCSAATNGASTTLSMQCDEAQHSATSMSDSRASCAAAANPAAAVSGSHGNAVAAGATQSAKATSGCNSASAGTCVPAAGTGAAQQTSAANSGSSMNAGSCAPTAGSGDGPQRNDAAAGSSGSASAAQNNTAAVSGSSTGGASSAGTHAGETATATAGTSASSSAATGCSAQNLIFCDDFEKQATAGMPPAAPWMIANNGMGHSVIDTQTPAHSGIASVKVTSEGGYQTFFALTGAPAFPHDGALYLRIYMRLDAAMTSGHNTYYKAGASGNPSSDHETRMGVMNGMLMINQPAGDRGFLSNEEYYRDGNKPGVVFAPMTWVCVETFFDPANKTIDVWVDGNEVKDLHRSDWEQDPIGSLHFGFEKYAGPDATIWYDDIALSSQPIGCR